ncbi:alkaline phosphatase family protein [Methanocella sp. MCL-LM]|uniref:alkaline phosphatase family protein n=1 Tax=Methanocella sp. MCL-LM TaxID=3412035 RepID=UPI003C744A2F
MNLPDYFVNPQSCGQYRIENLPGTILSMLTSERPAGVLPPEAFSKVKGDYDKVVLLLVDGIGWAQFANLAIGRPFIGRLIEDGALHKLATQFPSTTACNVTTVNTGLSVLQHGLYEWFYYEPKADDIIAPLLYAYAREQSVRDSLKRDTNVRPAEIYPAGSLYQKLSSHGVKGYAFQNNEYARSTFSDLIFKPATVGGFESTADGLAALAKAILAETEKAYFYFYYDGIDSALHHYGPGSEQVAATFTQFLTDLEEVFWRAISSAGKDKAGKVVFILTADHGQTSIDPARTIYLNREFPEIEGYMRRNRAGRVMAPAGSCRDMFLYVREECLDDAFSLLQEKLDGRAVVCCTTDLISGGYFGAGEPSEALGGRLGNLVILPLQGESVWWYEKDVFEVTFKGHHGGLTRDEMEIPLLIWSI